MLLLLSSLAGATTLTTYDSCSAYDDAVIDAVTDQLTHRSHGYYGWGGMPRSSVAESADASTAGAASSGPTSVTGTNVQEVGVDEQDIVKTDGRFVYALNGTELAIVKSWPVTEVEKVSAVPLEGQPSSLFLDGDRVMVLSHTYDQTSYQYGTRATIIDVADRAQPKVVRTVDLKGQNTQARLVDGRAFLVLNVWNALPPEVWNIPYSDDRETVREQVRTVMWGKHRELLTYVDTVPGYWPRVGNALDCGDVLTDGTPSGLGMVGVVNLDLHDDHEALDASAVMGNGWTVYASTESMYVAETAWLSGWGWDGGQTGTEIHKFDITGDAPEYRASGRIDGWLLNQFAMSEHEGNLRVAATEEDWWWGMGGNGKGSAVSVLRDDGQGQLVVTGRVAGLAPGEQIYGVRFDGDRGYVVTFRQIDPLFVVDLSDPSEPTVRGELKIPGYSSYLHPIEGGYLLAVGMDGDMQGRIDGLKVSIFDVRDMDRPREIQKYTVRGDGWSWSEALYDHKAFTYRDGVLAIPAYIYDAQTYVYEAGLLVMDADPKRGISQRGYVSHADLAQGGNWVNVRRSMFLDDVLVSVSNHGIKFNDLDRPKNELASVALSEGANHYYW